MSKTENASSDGFVSEEFCQNMEDSLTSALTKITELEKQRDELLKTVREYYTASELCVHPGDFENTYDDRMRQVFAAGEIHAKLKAIDSAKGESK